MLYQSVRCEATLVGLWNLTHIVYQWTDMKQCS